MGLSWKDLDPSRVAKNIETTIRNPLKRVSQVTGVKLPQTIRIGGKDIGTGIGTDALLKQAKSSLRDVKQAGRQAHTDWNNASRGEIGKYIAKTGEGVYGTVAAIPRAAISGNWEKELQRGYGNSRMALSPIENMIGENQGWQNALKDKNLNKWTLGTAKNFAGQTHGHATMQSSGILSNEDRVQWQQLSVKAAAVVAAIFGGGAAASAYGGSGTAGAGATGTVTLGTPTVTTVGVGTAGAGAGTTAAGAAAAGTPWWGTALAGAGTAVGTAVGTGLINRGTQAATDGATNWLDDLIGGGRDETSPGINPPMFSDPTGNAPGSYGGDGVESFEGGGQFVAIGAACLVGYLLYRRFA